MGKKLQEGLSATPRQHINFFLGSKKVYARVKGFRRATQEKKRITEVCIKTWLFLVPLLKNSTSYEGLHHLRLGRAFAIFWHWSWPNRTRDAKLAVFSLVLTAKTKCNFIFFIYPLEFMILN